MDAADRISEAYRHCERIVRAHDKDRYIASLFAPSERRPFLFALYAFAYEIGRVRALSREPMAGTIRLQWWFEALGGLRAEEAAASPVMLALQGAARQTGVSLLPLTAAVEARQAELHGAPASEGEAAEIVMAARFLGVEEDTIAAAAKRGAEAVTATEPDKARDAYVAFRRELAMLPERALPAFLTVALVPLRLRRPHAPQWRRQLALLRAAWFGFPPG